MTAPIVKVDVAFNAGYRTAAASRTWTDVSDYAELRDEIGINYGRQDERSTADANQCSLVLDNRDGRFTWGNASSPYYPNVLRGRPVRVSVNFCTPGDGGTFEANATGWSGNNATVARSTAQAHAGSASLSVTASTAATMTAQTASGTSGIPVAPGVPYRLSAWFLRGSVDRTCDMRIDWYDSAGALISTSSSAGITDGTTWARDDLAATSPALSAYARLRLRVVSPGAGEVHYIDDVRLDVTRYTGFIDGWRTQWSGGSGSYAVVPLSAASRLARLGLSQKVKSVIEQEIIADGPVAYYTLGEPEGSTRANDSSGNQAPALGSWDWGSSSSAPVVFGQATGPGTDGLTAAQFAAGKALRSVDALDIDTNPSGRTVSAFFNSSTGVGGIAQAGGLILGYSATGQLRAIWDGDGSNFVTSIASTYGDSQTHHAAATYSVSGGNETLELFIDGVSQGTVTSATSATDSQSLLSVGDLFTGSLAHVAVFDSALSATRILAHAEAGLTGFAGETTDTRLERYATWASIAADEVVTTASSIAVAHIPSDDQSVLDLMRKVETTEAGVLHDDRGGKLTLRNRNARYQAATVVTLDASSGQEVGSDFNPVVDGGSLANVGDGKSLDGTVTATYTNEASRTEYGDHTYSVETAATDPNEPLMLIGWVINSNATPRPRVSSVVVAVHTLGDAQAAKVMACDIGSKIRLTGLPTETPGGTAQDFFVEGYSESFGVGTWFITFNLSPSYPYDAVFILDDATHGVLDSDDILAL